MENAYERVLASGYLDALTDALDEGGWRVYDAQDGTLEIERWTDGTGYDFAACIDMRDRDAEDPQEWIDEAREIVEAFDPSESAVMSMNSNGAPALAEILPDFIAFKKDVLSQIPLIMDRAVHGGELRDPENIAAVREATRIGHDDWKARLSVIETRQRPDGKTDALLFNPTNGHTPFIVANSFDGLARGWAYGSYHHDLMDALCDLRGIEPPDAARGESLEAGIDLDMEGHDARDASGALGEPAGRAERTVSNTR